jgi:putative ATP-dependent endonuclease of OLD family
MGIKVAVVTDLDIKPLEWREDEDKSLVSAEEIEETKKKKYVSLATSYDAAANVRRFVSPNWTLEYEIALSQFRKVFYRDALWTRKKQDALIGEPKQSKRAEVKKKTKENFEKWKTRWHDDARCDEKIAFEIYKHGILDNNVSKAILAQEFRDWLLKYPHRKKLHSTLRNEENLNYIVDAICHVTEPLED